MHVDTCMGHAHVRVHVCACVCVCVFVRVHTSVPARVARIQGYVRNEQQPLKTQHK